MGSAFFPISTVVNFALGDKDRRVLRDIYKIDSRWITYCRCIGSTLFPISTVVNFALGDKACQVLQDIY